MLLLTEVLIVLVLVSLCSGLCHDIDTKACEHMVQQNPALCNDPALATTACPKFCGKCSSLVCYHCDASVRNFMDCNTTRTCQPGEQCILHELTSSRDGHHEYRMSCASLDMCDGTGVLFGRRDLMSRDVSTHCCTDDLCNYPTMTTVQTPTTTTRSGCSRDIEILIQDSADMASATYIIQFLKDLISNIEIGPSKNQVGLALIDLGTHRQFQLNSHSNKAELLRALGGIRFHHLSGNINIDDVNHFLNNELHPGKQHNGNRLAYKNNVIIIAQHETTDSHTHHHRHENLKANLSSVIVMEIGQDATDTFTTLATDPQNIIDVTDYTTLAQHTSQVLNLLCM